MCCPLLFPRTLLLQWAPISVPPWIASKGQLRSQMGTGRARWSPQQHLSKFQAASEKIPLQLCACVCVHTRVWAQCTLATCHEQSFAAGVHVGLPSISKRANTLYLCAGGKMLCVQIRMQMLLCSLQASRGAFWGCTGAPRAGGVQGVTACGPLRGSRVSRS